MTEEPAGARDAEGVAQPTVVCAVATQTTRAGRASTSHEPAAAKQEALEAAGVKVGKTPSETAALMREIMASLDSVVI